MKYIILFLTLCTLYACTNAKKQHQHTYEVAYQGALKNMMHKGDISAKADLSGFQETEHFYALGAVENLKGEILILNGKPFISSAQHQDLLIQNTFEQKAALLVYSTVDSWESFDIPNNAVTYAELEKHIEQAAKNNGINTQEPFPFLINGKVKSLDWHVINWKDGDTEHTHQKHINSGPHGTINNQNVDILGFYSNSHHTIFTHHSTNMHLHFKTVDTTVSGHVDGLVLGQDMTLQLPRVD